MQTTTTAAGAFTFSALGPGAYMLRYSSTTAGAACGGATLTVNTDGTFTLVTSPNSLITLNNYNWMTAYELTIAADPTPAKTLSKSIQEHIDVLGRAAWFKVKLPAGSTVLVSATNFDVNYDVEFFGDIGAAFSSFATNQDVLRLGAELNNAYASPVGFDSPVGFRLARRLRLAGRL